MKRLLCCLLALALAAGFGAMTAGTARAAAAPTTVVWYLPGSTPNNFDNVLAAVNDKLAASNLKLDLRIVEFGDYDSKMQLTASARENYDLVWTSSWLYIYDTNVSNGALMAIDDYLPQVPKLNDLIGKYWSYVKIGGKTYGVPNLQIMADQPGLAFRKDMVDKYNIDLSNIHTPADLTPIFQIIKDNEPGMNPIANGSMSMSDWDAATQTYHYVPQVDYYTIDTDTMQVMDNQKRLDRELALYSVSRDWQLKGFINQDIPTLTDQDTLWNNGVAFCKYSRYKPGAEAELFASSKVENICIPTGLAVISVAAVRSTLNAVSSTSQHPLEALKLLEQVNTDKELYNLLIFGIKDEDYTMTDADSIKQIDGGYSLGAWEVGNQFNALFNNGQSKDLWQQTMALNDSALKDPLGDFSFDPANVQAEMANIDAVRKEYTPILQCGLDDPAKVIAEREAKLDNAGQQKVIAEINKQLAAWKAAQK